MLDLNVIHFAVLRKPWIPLTLPQCRISLKADLLEDRLHQVHHDVGASWMHKKMISVMISMQGGDNFSSTDAAAALHSRKRFGERSNEQLSRWEMSRWELWCTEAMGSWADVGSWELWESRRWAQAAHWEESSCNSWDVLLGSVANLSTFFIHLTLICLLI